jgi:peptidoglycan/LPS O-acetylase OafA/YrhL
VESPKVELQERTSGTRYLELDGLRGVAAFTVSWHHFWLMFDLPEKLSVLPLIAGKQAVLLFFVLSGFVLSLPFWRNGHKVDYGRYLVRRFFRIYVPYAVSVLVYLPFAMHFGRHVSSLGSFFHTTWQTPVTWHLVLLHLAVWPDTSLNNALWSLRVEMWMSILFPLVILLLRVLPNWASALLAAAMVLVGARYSIIGPEHLLPLFSLVRYGAMFMFGALIAKNREALRVRWTRLGSATKWLVFGVSALMYWSYVDRLWLYLHLHWVPDWLNLMGAVGLLICALNVAGFRSFLRATVPEYLGRVSYSLYLMHELALYTVAILLFGKMPLIGIAAVYLVSMMALAHLFCICVEEPALRMGKYLTVKRLGAQS